MLCCRLTRPLNHQSKDELEVSEEMTSFLLFILYFFKDLFY